MSGRCVNMAGSTSNSYNKITGILNHAYCPFARGHADNLSTVTDNNWWVRVNVPQDNWAGWAAGATASNVAAGGYTGKSLESSVSGRSTVPDSILSTDNLVTLNIADLSVQPFPIYLFIQRSIAGGTWHSPIGEVPSIHPLNFAVTNSPIYLPIRSIATHDDAEFMLFHNYVQVAGRHAEMLTAIFGANSVAVSPLDLHVNYDIVARDGSLPGGEGAQAMMRMFELMAKSPELMQVFDAIFTRTTPTCGRTGTPFRT